MRTTVEDSPAPASPRPDAAAVMAALTRSPGRRMRPMAPVDAEPVDAPPEGYVTAEQIADELARVTGRRSVRPSTIRGMASREQMPAPTDLKWRRRTLWDAAQIDQWLQQREARHIPAPTVRQIQRRLTELDEYARRTGNDARLKEGVRDAHQRGLSYQQIADAIKVKNGDHHPTREAVRARFQRYF